jgi:hypothetical protein
MKPRKMISAVRVAAMLTMLKNVKGRDQLGESGADGRILLNVP